MSILLKELVGKISWHVVPDGMKLLEKQLTKIGLYGLEKQGVHSINKFSLKPIEEQLERMFLEWRNPFAESVVRKAFKLVFSIQEKTIKVTTNNTANFTKYAMTDHHITNFGTLLIK